MKKKERKFEKKKDDDDDDDVSSIDLLPLFWFYSFSSRHRPVIVMTVPCIPRAIFEHAQ